MNPFDMKAFLIIMAVIIVLDLLLHVGIILCKIIGSIIRDLSRGR